MLRSGFLLGVVGPAAIVTLMVLPTVRASADRLVQQDVPAASPQGAMAVHFQPGMMRPVSFEISPVHNGGMRIATMPRPEPGVAPATTNSMGPSASEKELPKPRRLTREGCETPLSSLVGPEARRMVPGRCMA